MKILIKNNEDLQHIHKLFKKKENYNQNRIRYKKNIFNKLLSRDMNNFKSHNKNLIPKIIHVTNNQY